MVSELRKVNKRSIEAYKEFGGKLKHAARCILWLPEAQALKSQKKRFLKYFTLPGKWAWDIFFFECEKIIEKRERGFPDVRFCDNNLESYTTAKKLLGYTIGAKRNFEDLVLNDREEFWDAFPYDIYNLDFCGTCLPDKQPPFSDTFESINKIIEHHVSNRAFPFLLFLTMKAAPNETREEAKRDLIQNIEDNSKIPDFADIVNRVVPNPVDFSQTRFADFIILSVPKVICHLSDAHCKVEVLHRAKYSRHGFYITKFVFRFERRRRTRLRLYSHEYEHNIKEIMRLDNVKTIDPAVIDANIQASHNRLQAYIMKLDQETE
jgi:hypothetical protein